MRVVPDISPVRALSLPGGDEPPAPERLVVCGRAQGVRFVTWTRAVTGPGTVAILAMLLVAAMAMPAAAAKDTRGRSAPPGHARFEGRTIDLTEGWGAARACVVWTRDGETDCYRSEAAADRAVAKRDRATARSTAMLPVTSPFAVPSPWTLLWASSCADWLTLYEHTGYGGRSLRFRDQGYYQDLAAWGFAGETSSYRVGSCPATLRDGGWTAYPGWTGAGATAWSMASGWNDRIRYLRIS